MTLDTNARRQAARELASRIFNGGFLKTAGLNLDNLLAAVGSIDDTMDALPATLNPAISAKANFVARLPEPFKSRSTAQEKSFALMVWAMREVGVI